MVMEMVPPLTLMLAEEKRMLREEADLSQPARPYSPLRYRNTFDTPRDLSAQLACATYAVCAAAALISVLCTYHMSFHLLCNLIQLVNRSF